jgi:hypothetical protein
MPIILWGGVNPRSTAVTRFQLKSAHRVFDEMAARTKFFIFENFRVWVITILDKGSRYISLRSKSDVLQKLTWILGMPYDLNSNFGKILNSVREIILEVEN